MNRRAALRQTLLVGGVAALWAALPARTWAALAPPPGWSSADEDLLTLIGDTILPETPGAPGAGAVGIGRFIVTMTTECFGPEASEALRRGLDEIQSRSQARFSRSFSELATPDREAILVGYEQHAAAETKAGAVNPFHHLKELTLLGYFTSEPGATQALRYDPVPGGYHGSISLDKAARSWAM